MYPGNRRATSQKNEADDNGIEDIGGETINVDDRSF